MVGNIDIKKDRLRYTKNTTSSTLAYIAILFNVLYFISIYHKDVGNYYYTTDMGLSVIRNFLFPLFTFFCPEGLKNYQLSYPSASIPLRPPQLVRILGIPMDAHNTVLSLDGENVVVMDNGQFIWVSICLIASAIACFVAAAIGIHKTNTLRNYEKQINA